MNTQMKKDSTASENKKTAKKQRSAALWVMLTVIVFMLLLSIIVLGSQLYKMATSDQYTVDLGVGNMESSVELFRIEYTNESDEITVQGINADNVVAPGTAVNYDIRLRNNDDVVIDFLMSPSVEFLTEDQVPVQFRIVDDYGNYILGDENTWVSPEDVNALYHRGSIHPGEVFTYHVSWRWIFEVSDQQDSFDTFLGNQNGAVLPGVRVGIETDAVANPMPVKSNVHMMHLLGESFGCCWCCYLLCVLLLVCLLLLIWVWRLHRRVDKQVKALDKYEEVLKAHGLLTECGLMEHSYEQ